MAWEPWDPWKEPYVDYLNRNHNNPNVFQEAAPAPPPQYPVYGPTGNGQTGTSYAPAAPAAPAAPSNADFDAYIRDNPSAADSWAYLENLLNEFGIGDLASWAQQEIIHKRSPNEIVQRLKTQDTYKKRFAVIEQRKELGLPAVSEQEVVAYEKQATQLMRAAGMPKGFYDQPEDFLKLQVNDISLAELDTRITQGYIAANNAPAEVRAELERLYGVTTSQLAAFYMDPDRTTNIIMQNFGAAQRAAEAQRSGFGNISQTEAERLTAAGISTDQANQGFGTLVTNRELFNTLPGEGAEDISRDEQFGAVFDSNARAKERIERRAKERAAAFGNGGGFASGQGGFSGVGEAR